MAETRANRLRTKKDLAHGTDPSPKKLQAPSQVPRLDLQGLQRRAGNRSVIQSLQNARLIGLPDLRESPGQQLDPQLKSSLQPEPGAVQPDVRVHTDSKAAQAADELGARAFTINHDIYFASGEYQPDTPTGKRLISHELTHTRQAGGGAQSGGEALQNNPILPVDSPGSLLEQQAAQAANHSTTHVASRTVSPHSRAGSAPMIQRQPIPGEEDRSGLIVVIGARKRDVEGARKLAVDLARKIRERRLDVEDLATLRRAEKHFTGRALSVFRATLIDSLKDLSLLDELRQHAPRKQETGHLPSLLDAYRKPRSTTDALKVAREQVQQIYKGKLDPQLREDIEGYLLFFQGKARRVYRQEITKAITFYRSRNIRYPSERTHLEYRGGVFGEGIFGETHRYSSTETQIFPSGEPETRYSYSVTVYAEIRRQTSDSVSVEYYTDVSAGVEASINIPVPEKLKKVVNLKIGGSYKKGRKESTKNERSKAKLNGLRIAKNFLVERQEREVLRRTLEETYDETKNYGQKSGDIQSIERTINPPKSETQTGYLMTDKENQFTRAIWPIYRGSAEDLSAEELLSQAFDAEGIQLAEELARLAVSER